MDQEAVDDIKRHFGIVAEGLRSDVRLVAEGQDLLTQRFDGLDQRFEGLERRFDGFEQRFDGLERRFDGLERRFDGFEQRFEGFQRRVETEFQEVKAMIRLSYAEIDRRFTVLEADLAALRTRVDRIESRR